MCPAGQTAGMSKQRLEAFTDGVLAIAITLLVLDLREPLAGESVGHALRSQWPQLGAFVVSFAQIGVVWVNHHAVFRYARRVDRAVTFVNLALLLAIVTVPFSASLYAEGLRRGDADARIAAAFFSVDWLLVGLFFGLTRVLLTRSKAGLLEDGIDATTARRLLLRFGAGNVVYAVLIALSFVAPLVVLVLHGLVAIYYVADQLTLPAAAPELGQAG